MSRDITEADWAMADRIIKMQQISPPLSERHKLAYTSMLVRTGVMNSIPVDVDPDIVEAEKLRDRYYQNGSKSITEFFVKAIKRGRELGRAEPKESK
jgi:hypothetical protein